MLHILAVVVPHATTDEISIDDARLVDEDPATDFQVEPALPHTGHPTPFDHARPTRYFDAVADAGDRLVGSSVFPDVESRWEMVRDNLQHQESVLKEKQGAVTNVNYNKSTRAGRYVRQPGDYKAFIPNPLPPDPPVENEALR